MKEKKRLSSDTLHFINDNVLSVTQLTRTKKLTEILDSYSNWENNEDVYVVQNNKKPAKAVIVNFAYFQEMLAHKEAIDRALDEAVDEMASERIHSVANRSLDQVIKTYDLDVDRIVHLVDKVEEED